MVYLYKSSTYRLGIYMICMSALGIFLFSIQAIQISFYSGDPGINPSYQFGWPLYHP